MIIFKTLSFVFLVIVFITSNPAGVAIAVPDSLKADNNLREEIELLNIDGSSRFSNESPHAGDTLSYIITVEWSNPKIPFMVLGPESLSYSGFKQISASTDHKKISGVSSDGAPRILNKSTFIYGLKALAPGSGRASQTMIPYYSVMSKEKEYLNISPSIINILPARVPFHGRWYIQILLFTIAAGAAAYAVRYVIKMRSGKKRGIAPSGSISSEIKELKSRINIADSGELLLQMEQLCLKYLKTEIPGAAGSKFEDLLKDFLQSRQNQHKEHWEKLKQDFELAKFGGGRKESHELLESYKLLKICLNIKEEDDHD